MNQLRNEGLIGRAEAVAQEIRLLEGSSRDDDCLASYFKQARYPLVEAQERLEELQEERTSA